MGIGKRLIIGFLITALLGSLSGIISAVSLRSMNNSYDHALKNFGFAQGDIGNAMTAMAQMSASARDVIGFTDKSDTSPMHRATSTTTRRSTSPS